MTQRQEAKFAMHNTVISLLIEHTDTWKNTEAFAESILTYRDRHDFTSNVIKEKARKLAGVNSGKQSKKLALATVAQKNAGLLRAYASKTGNLELLAEMTFTRTELRRISDNRLGPVAKDILEKVEHYKTELTKYNVTEEKVISFGKMIEEYKTTSSSTQKAKMVRKSLGVRLSSLLAELDALLDNEIEQFMLDFENSHPDFYLSYKNCKLIVDPKTSPTQFSGSITNADTGEVIKNVLIQVSGTNYITNSKEGGVFKLQIPKPGSYSVTFDLDGYQTTTADGDLKLGKTTEMNVVMKRIG